MFTILRGARFRPMDAQVCLLQQTVDSQLRLEPEPTNKFDPNAIKVHATDPDGVEHFVGYIAKENCEDVLDMLRSGITVEAFIAEENGNAPKIAVEYIFDDESTFGDAED